MPDDVRVRSLADALHEGREEITRRWLERIAARVAVEREFLFPSNDLLDHVPRLIAGLAAHVAGTGEITTNAPVAAKARELGRIRFEQGFNARQILWEYEILGGLILQYVDELDPSVPGAELPASFVRGLLRGLMVIQRATIEEYLVYSEAQVKEREDRLRGFNHALSHELRNEAGAILSAGRMLQEAFVLDDAALRTRFVNMVLQNGERIDHLIGNLLELAMVDLDTRRNRNVLLAHAVSEVARQLRGFADMNAVRIEVDARLPRMEVNAAAVDLALTNLVGNAIKYHRPDAPERWVRIGAVPNLERPAGDEVTIEVVDNGRGVPEEDRPQLFKRLFRSGSTADVAGTGLGLSLVRDAVERVGGRVQATFPDSGETVFSVTLPARRADDAPPEVLASATSA